MPIAYRIQLSSTGNPACAPSFSRENCGTAGAARIAMPPKRAAAPAALRNTAALTVGPNAAAIASLDQKQLMPTTRTSRELEELPLHQRDAGFFSARVSEERKLSALRAGIAEALNPPPGKPFKTRDQFVADMRNTLGYGPKKGQIQGDSADLADLGSTRRLNLIYDVQIQQAYEKARMVAGSDPAILDEWPAQELVRIEHREMPRKWHERWMDAGGKTYGGGRMIALKDSPVWAKISRFGTNYPPFDFNSGMGVEDIDRDEAIALGVLKPAQKVRPPKDVHESALEFSAKDLDEESRAALREEFPDMEILNNTLHYKTAPLRTAQDYGLEVAEKAWEMAVMPKPMDSTTALSALKKGVSEIAPDGLTVHFDDAVLKHWKGKPDEGNRPAFLPLALETIKSPSEIWKSRSVTNYLKGFTDGGKKRAVLVSVTNDGRVRTWVYQNLSKIEPTRKGEQLLPLKGNHRRL